MAQQPVQKMMIDLIKNSLTGFVVTQDMFPKYKGFPYEKLQKFTENKQDWEEYTKCTLFLQTISNTKMSKSANKLLTNDKTPANEIARKALQLEIKYFGDDLDSRRTRGALASKICTNLKPQLKNVVTTIYENDEKLRGVFDSHAYYFKFKNMTLDKNETLSLLQTANTAIAEINAANPAIRAFVIRRLARAVVTVSTDDSVEIKTKYLGLLVGIYLSIKRTASTGKSLEADKSTLERMAQRYGTELLTEVQAKEAERAKTDSNNNNRP